MTCSIIICYPFPDEWNKDYAIMGPFIIYYVIPLAIIALIYIFTAKRVGCNNFPGELRRTQRRVRNLPKIVTQILDIQQPPHFLLIQIFLFFYKTNHFIVLKFLIQPSPIMLHDF